MRAHNNIDEIFREGLKDFSPDTSNLSYEQLKSSVEKIQPQAAAKVVAVKASSVQLVLTAASLVVVGTLIALFSWYTEPTLKNEKQTAPDQIQITNESSTVKEPMTISNITNPETQTAVALQHLNKEDILISAPTIEIVRVTENISRPLAAKSVTTVQTSIAANESSNVRTEESTVPVSSVHVDPPVATTTVEHEQPITTENTVLSEESAFPMTTEQTITAETSVEGLPLTITDTHSFTVDQKLLATEPASNNTTELIETTVHADSSQLAVVSEQSDILETSAPDSVALIPNAATEAPILLPPSVRKRNRIVLKTGVAHSALQPDSEFDYPSVDELLGNIKQHFVTSFDPKSEASGSVTYQYIFNNNLTVGGGFNYLRTGWETNEVELEYELSSGFMEIGRWKSETTIEEMGLTLLAGYDIPVGRHWLINTCLGFTGNRSITRLHSIGTSYYDELPESTEKTFTLHGAGSVDLVYHFKNLGISIGGTAAGRSNFSAFRTGYGYGKIALGMSFGVYYYL